MAGSPGQLALVPALQLAENLSDLAAADAVRTRIDWKYTLGLDWAIPDSTTRYCASFGPGRRRTAPPTSCWRRCCSGLPRPVCSRPGPTTYGRHPCTARGALPQQPGAGRGDAAVRCGGTG
ncbi:transposase [Streptomyces sp. NPDC093228]|uniref:transposase n=1 Tax=Streptomyces sp. NPDC093228 TaxID=3155070 RepID=UPI00342FFFD4